MTARLDQAEAALFERYATDDLRDAQPVFILGAPRTGSTLAYQALGRATQCTQLTNLINDEFPNHPVVGSAVGRAMGPGPHSPPAEDHAFSSRYGKTEGPWGPSEASAVFRNWYGGDHPSETHSARVVPERTEHLQRSIQAIEGLWGTPLLAKNAWNCFRVEDLATHLPGSRFLWIRRDIGVSASSDLEARHRRGSPTIWNSATPHDVEEIQRLPYWAQVVEQQVAYSRAIQASFERLHSERHATVWYEDLCAAPNDEIDRVSAAFRIERNGIKLPGFEPSQGPQLTTEDRVALDGYLADVADRIAPLRFRGASERP